jgi:hypothetical protein
VPTIRVLAFGEVRMANIPAHRRSITNRFTNEGEKSPYAENIYKAPGMNKINQAKRPVIRAYLLLNLINDSLSLLTIEKACGNTRAVKKTKPEMTSHKKVNRYHL